jgi:PilZ domain
MADYADNHRPDYERRVYPRVRLRWPLSILQNQENARILSTVTENLSSQGFSCVVDQPLATGERVQCILKLPPRLDPAASRALRCDAQVVWVSAQDDGRFGVGCRIHDYTFAVLEPT